MTAIVYFLAYDDLMIFRVLLFLGFQFSVINNLVCKEDTVTEVVLKSDIQITLISPDVVAGVEIGEVSLEGLVNDLSVSEVKLLVNAQEVQYVPVIKGYFSKKIYLLERLNRLTIYGSNSARKTFRYEYNVVNHSQREKTIDERIPPTIQLNYLQEDTFKVISPDEFENLQVEVTDNKDDIVQLAYIINDGAPVYLPRKQRLVRLDIGLKPSLRSIKLLIYVIDGDGNKVTQKYHFRVEDLGCKLRVSPEYGYYSKTPIIFNATIKGGTGRIRKIYTLFDKTAEEVKHETLNSISQVFLEKRNTQGVYRARLSIIDENDVKATCEAKTILKFYPDSFPKSFKILPKTKLQSVRQDLHFSIEPPVRGGEITILLKAQDSERRYVGDDWKVLGRKNFEANSLQQFWKVLLRRRVPVGKYQMKLSVVSDSSDIFFTEKVKVEVTKSKDDSEDLLQEILRGEQ